MRPRVDLFCLSENISLKQAADLLQREGYSRVPVYRETIDTIVGVLFYKDVLAKYAAAAEAGTNRETLLATPVKTLVKKVYYCPETKKIAPLLQEFRKRQTHMAVVVDEYGGTAGLVTIEDILEEIVGEISDEYDEQEALFSPAPGGGWIVDARMNLLDVEEEMGIKIPQEEDYDTLAGYIFYRVGSIPQAGLVLHHDTFEIEVLKSNDRMVEEVKIVPITNEEPSEE
jgi:CBS domain containing-hemolysin-like protein